MVFWACGFYLISWLTEIKASLSDLISTSASLVTCEKILFAKKKEGGECFTSLFVKNINYFQTCQIYQKVSLTRNKIKTTIQQLRKILAMCGFIFCMLLYNHMFVSLYIKTVCRNIDWGLFYASIDRENRWTIFPKKLLTQVMWLTNSINIDANRC